MSDPQDLLYTNQFIDENIITKEQINNDTQYQDRFMNYLDSNPENEVQNYLEKNLYEDDLVNIQHTIDKPWPIDNKKNRYPLISNISKDISLNRYTQEQNLQFIVNSDERNKNFFPNSTEFQITLPKPLNNVSSIELNDICVPNYNQNIGNMNNSFAWQYFSNYYLNNVNSFNIIPTPDINRPISYYNLPFSTYFVDIDKKGINYNPEVFLTYQLNIPSGYYDIDTLLKDIKILSTNVLHGGFSYNTVSLLGNESQGRIPDEELPTEMEEPYYSNPYMQNTPNLWDFEINMQNNAFFAVNRIEEVDVISYQTFTQKKIKLTGTEWKNIDIFYDYSDDSGNLDSDYIYITVPYVKDETNLWYEESSDNPFFPSAFPLVLSGLESHNGDLNSFTRNLNMTPFFDLNIYLKNTEIAGDTPVTYTEDEIHDVCYYKYNDTIKIPTQKGDIVLIRFALRYSSSGEKGKKHNNSLPVSALPTYAYNKSNQGISIVYNGIIDQNIRLKTNILFYFVDKVPLIGRALLTRFIYGQANGIFVNYEMDEDYENKKSLLGLLGFSIGNQTSSSLVADYNRGFAFVHSNRYPIILDRRIPEIYYNILPQINELITPQTKIEVTIESGMYYLSSKPYFFVQLLFIDNGENDSIGQFNFQSSQDTYNLSINKNYSNSYITNILPIGISITCAKNALNVRQKNKNNIIAKILTSEIPGNLNLVNNNISAKSILYSFDKVIDNVNVIQINILDSNYKIVESNKNLNFMTKFNYNVHKLKETSINTKTNNVDIIGNIN